MVVVVFGLCYLEKGKERAAALDHDRGSSEQVAPAAVKRDSDE